MRITLPIVLHNPKILLLGAGSVALQKARVMLRNGVEFDTIAAEAGPGFEQIGVPVTLRDVRTSDLDGYGIVIDATGSDAVAAMLLEQKQKRHFLLNVVDRPELCDFFFAALIESGPLKIAVSSSGASPALAQEVRDKIRRMLPAELDGLAEQSLTERNQGIIRADAIREQTRRLLGEVWLIGCGTGAADLLTLRAYRLIQEADVALVDHLVSEEIRALIPEKTETVYVGKCKGRPSISQEEINTMLVEYAAKGLNVARLKSGDPYIFGRGSEEAEAAAMAGMRVQVVPGISSALAGPLSAGIAPTARGYATNMSIVSAHLAGNRVNLEWLELLRLPNHTTIVLMGLSRAAQISEAALAAGVDPELKAAIICDASRPTQNVFIATLASLPDVAEKAHAPAIMVFGDVVALHNILPH